MAHKLEAFEDPNHHGNGPQHHTGQPCIVKGCQNPAGTWWGPHWCFACNVKRIRSITATLKSFLARRSRMKKT